MSESPPNTRKTRKEVRTVEELKEYSTAQLVAELRTREGVTEKIAEPYETLETEVEGPAIVLTVID